ncbi:MAG: hypothetical protein Q7K44_01510 [Candidatus Liptonbacteria bacterium]|nr:hypothetical protein [Candidatus Liptonbacteria bacterium]
MSKLSINKFAVFFFTLITVSFAQLNLKATFGWSPELILSALVISAFYLGVLEMATLCAFGILILNWRPFPGWEISLFFLLPFMVMFVKKIFPWRSMINGVLGTVLSVAVFYALSDWGAIISGPAVFAEILVLTGIFAAALFQILSYFYKTYSA